MKKILILDDNFEILLLYKTLVTHMGYVVKTSTRGDEALRWMDDESFDLILTDMKMPVMGGIEFVKCVREKGIQSKIIIITAFPTMADANQLAKLNIYSCLIKPVLLTKLEEIIRKALDEPPDSTPLNPPHSEKL